jgi:hypothetical protein
VERKVTVCALTAHGGCRRCWVPAALMFRAQLSGSVSELGQCDTEVGKARKLLGAFLYLLSDANSVTQDSLGQVPVVPACILTTQEAETQEDCSLKPALGK